MLNVKLLVHYMTGRLWKVNAPDIFSHIVKFADKKLSFILLFIHNLLLTPWIGVCLVKLTGSHLVKNLPEFNGTESSLTRTQQPPHVAILS